MKNIKIIFQVVLFLVIIFLCSKVNAASITLSSNKSTVNVGDEFTISMNLSGARVASLNSKVSIDTAKVQYVSSSSSANTNYNNGRILYTWTDNSGGSNPKTDGTIVTFTLKAISSGTANFSVSGSFYDSDENKINMNFNSTNVTIKEVVNEQPPNNNTESPPITEPETPPNNNPENPPTTNPENPPNPPNTTPENPPITQPETPTNPPSNQENPSQTGNNARK